MSIAPSKRSFKRSEIISGPTLLCVTSNVSKKLASLTNGWESDGARNSRDMLLIVSWTYDSMNLTKIRNEKQDGEKL